LADGVLDAGIMVRIERTQRPVEKQSDPWVDRQLGKIRNGLNSMAMALGDAPFCAGSHLSLADVAVGSALGWLAFRFPEINWRDDHTNLARLFDKLSERLSFKETVPVA
jgi:glutathione S-transferase